MLCDEPGHSPPVSSDDCPAVRGKRFTADLCRNFWRQRIAHAVSLAAGAGHLGGVAFLLWYGFGALKTAMSSNLELASAEVMKQGRWKIIVTMLAVTWLNPHVYLDTFVVLGSLGGQLDVEPKRWFALGTVSASFLWFFGLAILAAWLAPRLRTAKAQRIINTLVGLVMWFIAFQLAKEGIHHVQELFN